MNLNYGYDKEALAALVRSADTNRDEHALVIDFDGEVILDPEVYFPDVAVSSFQFATSIKDASLRYETMINALYDSLEMIYDNLNRDKRLYISGSDSIRIAA